MGGEADNEKKILDFLANQEIAIRRKRTKLLIEKYKSREGESTRLLYPKAFSAMDKIERLDLRLELVRRNKFADLPHYRFIGRVFPSERVEKLGAIEVSDIVTPSYSVNSDGRIVSEERHVVWRKFLEDE